MKNNSSQTNRLLKSPTNMITLFVVGLYTWIATVLLGLVLLDILYAGMIYVEAEALSEAADFLLFVRAITIFASLGAIGLSWESKVARNYLIASLIITISGFLAYIPLSLLLHKGSSLGSSIRIIITGSVSVLAFMGFYKFCRCSENHKP